MVIYTITCQKGTETNYYIQKDDVDYENTTTGITEEGHGERQCNLLCNFKEPSEVWK